MESNFATVGRKIYNLNRAMRLKKEVVENSDNQLDLMVLLCFKFSITFSLKSKV